MSDTDKIFYLLRGTRLSDVPVTDICIGSRVLVEEKVGIVGASWVDTDWSSPRCWVTILMHNRSCQGYTDFMSSMIWAEP